MFSAGVALNKWCPAGAYAGVYSAAAIIASLAGVVVVNEKVRSNTSRTASPVFSRCSLRWLILSCYEVSLIDVCA
eukprot:1139460-Pelagomonas_calceolata.AAC.4